MVSGVVGVEADGVVGDGVDIGEGDCVGVGDCVGIGEGDGDGEGEGVIGEVVGGVSVFV